MKKRPTLTTGDLLAGYTNEAWLGFGYLGARQSALDTSDPEAIIDPRIVRAADAFIVERANEIGMTAGQLFDWANSKDGRWTGDIVFGGGRVDEARNYIRGPAMTTHYHPDYGNTAFPGPAVEGCHEAPAPTELERALGRDLWALIGAPRWPGTNRRISARDRRRLAAFVVPRYAP